MRKMVTIEIEKVYCDICGRDTTGTQYNLNGIDACDGYPSGYRFAWQMPEEYMKTEEKCYDKAYRLSKNKS